MKSVAMRAASIAFVTLGLLGVAIAAAAQAPTKVFRVGYLSSGGQTPDGKPPAALREALTALGYAEGRNIAYETRFAEGKLDRVPGLAAELVRLKVDVIATQGGLATVAAK